MPKKKLVAPPTKPKRGTSWPLILFLLFAACLILAALSPKTTTTAGPTDLPSATDTFAATLSKLQAYQTVTWDAVTALANEQSYLAPTKTQQAQDRADAATMQYFATRETVIAPTLRVSSNSIPSGSGSNFDNVSGGAHNDGKGPTALCNDGSLWYNGTVRKGDCSHHKGVKQYYR